MRLFFIEVDIIFMFLYVSIYIEEDQELWYFMLLGKMRLGLKIG